MLKILINIKIKIFFLLLLVILFSFTIIAQDKKENDKIDEHIHIEGEAHDH